MGSLYVGGWFERQSAFADSSASLFSSIRYATLHCKLALSYLVNRESSAGLPSFQLLHHFTFLLSPSWQVELCNFGGYLVYWCSAKERIKQYIQCQVRCPGKPVSIKKHTSVHECSLCIWRCWELTRGEMRPWVELEAQIASVDSFVSLYKNILRLIIQLLFRLLFSDDKRRNTGLGGTCEM